MKCLWKQVSSRRLAIVQHRHPTARGLLSLISFLSAFLLTGIKRSPANGAEATGTSADDTGGVNTNGATPTPPAEWPLVVRTTQLA